MLCWLLFHNWMTYYCKIIVKSLPSGILGCNLNLSFITRLSGFLYFSKSHMHIDKIKI